MRSTVRSFSRYTMPRRGMICFQLMSYSASDTSGSGTSFGYVTPLMVCTSLLANDRLRIRPSASVTAPYQSQRTPKLMVSRDVAFQSSSQYKPDFLLVHVVRRHTFGRVRVQAECRAERPQTHRECRRCPAKK